jgi:hypothetical protein
LALGQRWASLIGSALDPSTIIGRGMEPVTMVGARGGTGTGIMGWHWVWAQGDRVAGALMRGLVRVVSVRGSKRGLVPLMRLGAVLALVPSPVCL